MTLRVRGSAMTFDFTGSDPQVRGPFNSVPASTMSAVYYAVRAISDASIPNNGGCFRAVDAVLPEGTIVNPRPPAPVSCRTATIKRIADTILGALVGALPGKMPAASSGTLLVMAFGGRDPETGRPFVASELAAGGMGARPGKDGIDVIETDVSNCMNIPVESVEMNFPLRIPRVRLWPGSGGAGRFRGGLGLEKVFEATTTDVTVSHRWSTVSMRDGGTPAARARASATAARSWMVMSAPIGGWCGFKAVAMRGQARQVGSGGGVGDGLVPAVLQPVEQAGVDFGGDVGVGLLDPVAQDVAEASGLGDSGTP